MPLNLTTGAFKIYILGLEGTLIHKRNFIIFYCFRYLIYRGPGSCINGTQRPVLNNFACPRYRANLIITSSYKHRIRKGIYFNGR